MFSRIFGKRQRKAEMTLKQFELWTKKRVVGTFIVQEHAECVGTVAAYTLEQANKEAPIGCYAVGKINE